MKHDFADQAYQETLLDLFKPGNGVLPPWKGLSQDEKDALRVRHLGGLLQARCDKTPLLVTLDEAHTLAEEMGATLLNLSESLRKSGAPFLLVLSGTPNLRDHLHKINATFWGRSEKLGIGRLTEAATEESLAKPLAELDIHFDKRALADVVTDSQYYPYFIQIWGKALCEVLVRETPSHRITTETVRTAYPVVDYKWKDYYQDRYNEMREKGLLEAADAVASVFAEQEIQNYDVLQVLLSRKLDIDKARALGQMKELSHLGYIWELGGDAACEPGIPSLMSHVQEKQARYRVVLD